jgi:hypothetical protein
VEHSRFELPVGLRVGLVAAAIGLATRLSGCAVYAATDRTFIPPDAGHDSGADAQTDQ